MSEINFSNKSFHNIDMGLVTKVMTLLPIATRVLDVGLLDC
jgi:hypothetical protein